MIERKVAIITRTKNRNLLLWRALDSVRNQTFKDFVWVVVNDGGEKDGVEIVINEARMSLEDVLVIHNEKSVGMEAASNLGIRSCKSQYIIIHDDDDTWENSFLERAVAFLESEPLFEGVVTHSLLVNETISGTEINTTSCYGFNTWLQSIYLMEMLVVNSFPPISFLYSRKVYDEIGGYDETLPVLGDWDFNIRFLEKQDIGVIPELLARYHHRNTITSPDDANGNTVNAGVNNHIRYDAILRNRYIRKNKDIGLLVNLAVMNTWQNHKIDKISVNPLIKAVNYIMACGITKFSFLKKFRKNIKGLGGR